MCNEPVCGTFEECMLSLKGKYLNWFHMQAFVICHTQSVRVILLVGCKEGLLMGSACVAYQVRRNSGGGERRVPTEDPELRF